MTASGPQESKMKNVLWSLIGFLALFSAWEIASVLLVRSPLFPPPTTVLAKLFELAANGSLLDNVAASLGRIASGFCLGSILGVPIGLLVGSNILARRLLEPWIEFLRFIPATAMITVAVIWFGIGEGSKIYLITYATIFVVVLNTASGVAMLSKNKIRAAQALGASRPQLFFTVILPATVPFILTGMRVAMANAFTTIVAAELVSAQRGLGVMLWNGRLYMLIDEIFVALLCLGLLGFLADRLFRWSILRLAGRFLPTS
jgi:ABC-type nitrate/sulfonate/bicarbonate transport system permease component